MIDNESGENYLEAVLQLADGEKDVHSVDVARKLGVSKPAVTKAMKLLCAKGYVTIVNNHIYLTETGRSYAQAVYEKHRHIAEFLSTLGVAADTAEVDACRLEHLISEETYEAMLRFLQNR